MPQTSPTVGDSSRHEKPPEEQAEALALPAKAGRCPHCGATTRLLTIPYARGIYMQCRCGYGWETPDEV
jgi:hypothetical protein